MLTLPDIQPSSFQKSDIPSLEYVNVSYNALVGLVYLSLFTGCKKFQASHNKISYIHESIGCMTSLTELDLSYNKLFELPSSFSSCLSLLHCNLSYNEFQTIPSSISLLKNLNELNISNNLISNISDIYFYTLSQLTTLKLDHNLLYNLPISLYTMPKLTYLQLQYNQISEFSSRFSGVTSLHSLNLSNNNISTIPSTISLLTNLTWLELSNNQLSALPNEIKLLPNVRRIGLERNLFTTIPSILENVPLLQNWNMSWNPIPSQLLLSDEIILDSMSSSCDDLQYNKLDNSTTAVLSLRQLRLKLQSAWSLLEDAEYQTELDAINENNSNNNINNNNINDKFMKEKENVILNDQKLQRIKLIQNTENWFQNLNRILAYYVRAISKSNVIADKSKIPAKRAVTDTKVIKFKSLCSKFNIKSYESLTVTSVDIMNQLDDKLTSHKKELSNGLNDNYDLNRNNEGKHNHLFSSISSKLLSSDSNDYNQTEAETIVTFEEAIDKLNLDFGRKYQSVISLFERLSNDILIHVLTTEDRSDSSLGTNQSTIMPMAPSPKKRLDPIDTRSVSLLSDAISKSTTSSVAGLSATPLITPHEKNERLPSEQIQIQNIVSALKYATTSSSSLNVLEEKKDIGKTTSVNVSPTHEKSASKLVTNNSFLIHKSINANNNNSRSPSMFSRFFNRGDNDASKRSVLAPSLAGDTGHNRSRADSSSSISSAVGKIFSLSKQLTRQSTSEVEGNTSTIDRVSMIMSEHDTLEIKQQPSTLQEENEDDLCVDEEDSISTELLKRFGSNPQNIARDPDFGSRESELFALAFECYFGLGSALLLRVENITNCIRYLEELGSFTSRVDIPHRKDDDLYDIVYGNEGKYIREGVETGNKKKDDKVSTVIEIFKGISSDKLPDTSNAIDNSTHEKKVREKPAWCTPEILTKLIEILWKRRTQVLLCANTILESAGELIRVRGWDPLIRPYSGEESSVDATAAGLRPVAVRFFYIRGLALQYMSLYSDAKSEHQRALCIGQRWRPAQIALVKCLIALGDFPRAKVVLTSIMSHETPKITKKPTGTELVGSHPELGLLLMVVEDGEKSLSNSGYNSPLQQRVFYIHDDGRLLRHTTPHRDILYGLV